MEVGVSTTTESKGAKAEERLEKLEKDLADLSAVEALLADHDPRKVTLALKHGVITAIGNLEALPRLNMVEMVLVYGGGEQALRAVLADPQCRRYVDPHGDNCLHSILMLAPSDTEAAMFVCATEYMSAEEVVKQLLSPNEDGYTPVDLARRYDLVPLAQAMKDFIGDYHRKLREEPEKQKLLRDYRFIEEVALLAVLLVCHGCVVFADSSFSFSKLKTSPLLCAHVVFLCIAFVYLLSVILYKVASQRVGRGAANITNAESTEIVAADSVTTTRGAPWLCHRFLPSWWRGVFVVLLYTCGIVLAILQQSQAVPVAYVVLSCFSAVVALWIVCMFCCIEPSAVSSTPVIPGRGQQREMAGSSNSEGEEVVSNGNESDIPPATSVVGSLKVEEGSKTAITGSVGTGENVEENEEVTGTGAAGGQHR